MYKNKYKQGSYGGQALVDNRQKKTLAKQQQARYAKVIAARDGGAPLSNRGFSSMAYRANREKKFFDTPQAYYTITNAGGFTPLFIPRLGSDFYQRIGRKCLIKSLYIRGFVAMRSAIDHEYVGAVPCTMMRLIVVWDNQPNGAAPATTDLLNNADVASQLNPNNRDRFMIIKDKQYVFDPLRGADASSAWNRTIYPVKCYKKLNLETIFNQLSAGNIGDITTGALYMFWISSSNVAGSEGLADLSIRCRFDDQ